MQIHELKILPFKYWIYLFFLLTIKDYLFYFLGCNTILHALLIEILYDEIFTSINN
jgi:hypothetical protein